MAKKPQRGWTTTEVNYLLDNAGIKSVAEIADDLGRSENSVKQKARHLSHHGRKLSLRASGIRVCQSCGKPRSKFTRDGICAVCNLHRLIDGYEKRISETYKKLSAKDKATYARTENRLKSELPDRKPNKRSHRKKSDQDIVDDENFQIAYLTRIYNARKQRLGRMQKKLLNSQKK